jgi:hypothetical protein
VRINTLEEEKKWSKVPWMKPPLNLLDPLGGVLKRVLELVKKGDSQGGLDCMYDFARSTGDPMSLSISYKIAKSEIKYPQ